MRRTKQQIRQLMDDIGRLTSMGMTDPDMIKKLEVSASQFYRWRRQLYLEHSKEFAKCTPEDLAFHKDVLKERLIRILRAGEIKLTRMIRDEQERSSSSSSSFVHTGRDVAAVMEVCQELSINLFKLESESIRILNGETNRHFNRIESRELPEPTTNVLSISEGENRSIGIDSQAEDNRQNKF